jgi:hypothetical protein
MFEVGTKHASAPRYVSMTAHVNVKDLDTLVSEAVRRLRAEHEQDGLAFTLYHGPVNEMEDGPVVALRP